MPPPSAVLSTPRAKRRSSVRVRPGHAEDDVDLLEGARSTATPPGVRPRGPRRRGAAAGAARRRSRKPSRPKALRTRRTTVGVVDVAGGRDDHVRRVGSAAGRSARIWSRVSALIESTVPSDRAGRAACRRALAAANRSCTTSPGSSSCIAISSRITPRSASTSSPVISRGGDHVAEDVDRERQVVVEHPRVVAGVLLGGEGVDLAADRVERRRDVQRAAPRGALEEQVLEEVGGSRAAAGVSSREPTPTQTPKVADRTPGIVLGDDPQPAGQDGAADRVPAVAVLDGARVRVRARRLCGRLRAVATVRRRRRVGVGRRRPRLVGALGLVDHRDQRELAAVVDLGDLDLDLLADRERRPRRSRRACRRRACGSCEMCSRPSLPGSSETNAPKVVVLTTVPR